MRYKKVMFIKVSIFIVMVSQAFPQFIDKNAVDKKIEEQSRLFSIQTEVARKSIRCASQELSVEFISIIKNSFVEDIVFQKHLEDYSNFTQKLEHYESGEKNGYFTHALVGNYPIRDINNHRNADYVFLRKGESLKHKHNVTLPLSTKKNLRNGIESGIYQIVILTRTWRANKAIGDRFKVEWAKENKLLWIEPLVVSFSFNVTKKLANACRSK
jgi:hypothetical protein